MKVEMLRALDLFSGIGGITYGLRGIVTPIAYVEKDQNAREFLKRKHPDIPVFDDVCTFDATLLKGNVDIITAGWPCTGFSTAGKGGGFSHEASGLFTEVVRIAKECEPRFLFLENSHVLSRKEKLDVVVSTFDDLGYDCRWMTCHATCVGAPHQRHRWFCLVMKRFSGSDIDIPRFDYIFDWSVEKEPEKQIKENTHENKTILGFVGNSVIPDQVRYTFYKLMKKECHERLQPPLNISLVPRVNTHKTKEENVVKTTVIKKYWGTPCYSFRTHTRGNNVLTKRHLSYLPTQVRFSPQGIDGYNLNGFWCAWLMGYTQSYFT